MSILPKLIGQTDKKSTFSDPKISDILQPGVTSASTVHSGLNFPVLRGCARLKAALHDSAASSAGEGAATWEEERAGSSPSSPGVWNPSGEPLPTS